MEYQNALYLTGAVAITFLVLFIVYIVKYNQAKDEQNCVLGTLSEVQGTGAKTLTAAQSVQSSYNALTNGSAFAVTLPAASAIITQINTIASNTCKPLTFTVINTSGSALTFTPGTGTTIAAAPATGNFTIYQINVTSSTTVSYTVLATGTVTTV